MATWANLGDVLSGDPRSGYGESDLPRGRHGKGAMYCLPNLLTLEPAQVWRSLGHPVISDGHKAESKSCKFIVHRSWSSGLCAGGTSTEGDGDGLPQGNPGGGLRRNPHVLKSPEAGSFCCKG